ncbi:hypothetical protein DPX16_22552 [Anabarilius grahami]|uniref:Uncharacterized protein n=1 Tax=Anabarilius grahami TaxID=495550 RepID=A0A3N0XHN1_ANAGA|nr:hypothetical protein DPX16_22552 [Anabarilius grahami]
MESSSFRFCSDSRETTANAVLANWQFVAERQQCMTDERHVGQQRHVEDESGGKRELRLSKKERTFGDAAVVMRVDYAAWEFQ